MDLLALYSWCLYVLCWGCDADYRFATGALVVSYQYIHLQEIWKIHVLTTISLVYSIFSVIIFSFYLQNRLWSGGKGLYQQRAKGNHERSHHLRYVSSISCVVWHVLYGTWPCSSIDILVCINSSLCVCVCVCVGLLCDPPRAAPYRLHALCNAMHCNAIDENQPMYQILRMMVT